jgi:hypothetical protein
MSHSLFYVVVGLAFLAGVLLALTLGVLFLFHDRTEPGLNRKWTLAEWLIRHGLVK